jgi:hypothetical protein
MLRGAAELADGAEELGMAPFCDAAPDAFWAEYPPARIGCWALASETNAIGAASAQTITVEGRTIKFPPAWGKTIVRQQVPACAADRDELNDEGGLLPESPRGVKARFLLLARIRMARD